MLSGPSLKKRKKPMQPSHSGPGEQFPNRVSASREDINQRKTHHTQDSGSSDNDNVVFYAIHLSLERIFHVEKAHQKRP